MADAVAGGDTRLLGKMMERGELKPAEVLPKFFALMEERAQQGWGTYQQSIAYQQGQAGYQFSNLIKAFTFNGGEQGFVNMWKMVQQSLKEMLPLAKRLGESFFDISKNFENITNLIRLASKLMSEEGDIFAPWTKSLLNFAALVSSKFYRIFYVMDKIMMFAEDFMAYKAGESSHIGDVLNGGGGWIGVLVSGLEQAGWATLIFAGIIAKLGHTILKMTGVLWAAKKLLDGGGKGLPTPSTTKSLITKTGLITTAKAVPYVAAAAAVGYGYNNEMNRRNEGGSPILMHHEMYGGVADYYRKKAEIKQMEASVTPPSFSTESINFVNAMAGFQGMSPNLQNPSKVANMNGKGVTQVIENLNVNIDGSNQPPELLARAIRQEADRMSFNQLQLTPNAY